MEKVNPKLAVAIHHHILKFSLVCRERLEKEVSGLESLDHQLKKTKKKKITSYWNRRTNLLSHSKPDEIGNNSGKYSKATQEQCSCNYR